MIVKNGSDFLEFCSGSLTYKSLTLLFKWICLDQYWSEESVNPKAGSKMDTLSVLVSFFQEDKP